MKKKKSSDNYLDYIPVRNPEFGWKENEKGRVEIAVINKGFFNKIAQTFFKKPRISQIELDAYGSFLWKRMDGKTDVSTLSKQMKEEFGEQAEPLLERLVVFLKTLQVNKYISYKNRERGKKNA